MDSSSSKSHGNPHHTTVTSGLDPHSLLRSSSHASKSPTTALPETSSRTLPIQTKPSESIPLVPSSGPTLSTTSETPTVTSSRASVFSSNLDTSTSSESAPQSTRTIKSTSVVTKVSTTTVLTTIGNASVITTPVTYTSTSTSTMSIVPSAASSASDKISSATISNDIPAIVAPVVSVSALIAVIIGTIVLRRRRRRTQKGARLLPYNQGHSRGSGSEGSLRRSTESQEDTRTPESRLLDTPSLGRPLSIQFAQQINLAGQNASSLTDHDGPAIRTPPSSETQDLHPSRYSAYFPAILRSKSSETLPHSTKSTPPSSPHLPFFEHLKSLRRTGTMSKSPEPSYPALEDGEGWVWENRQRGTSDTVDQRASTRSDYTSPAYAY